MRQPAQVYTGSECCSLSHQEALWSKASAFKAEMGGEVRGKAGPSDIHCVVCSRDAPVVRTKPLSLNPTNISSSLQCQLMNTSDSKISWEFADPLEILKKAMAPKKCICRISHIIWGGLKALQKLSPKRPHGI